MPPADDSVIGLLLSHGKLAEQMQYVETERQRIIAEQSAIRAALAARLGSVQDAELRGRILEILQMYDVSATAVNDWRGGRNE